MNEDKREDNARYDNEEEEFFSNTPENALDFNMKLIDPAWGSKDVPKELRDQLSKFKYIKDKEGNILRDAAGRPKVTVEESLWALLGFYTKDMRLSNLDQESFQVCSHYINLANDYLRLKFFEAFFCALSRAVTVLELRQSYRGFLRRRQSTMTTERISKGSGNVGSSARKGLFSKFKPKK